MGWICIKAEEASKRVADFLGAERGGRGGGGGGGGGVLCTTRQWSARAMQDLPQRITVNML